MAAEQTTATPRRRLVAGLTAGGLVAVAIGVLVGYLIFGQGKDSDAKAACSALDRVPASASTLDKLSLQDPVLWRLQALGPLAQAAGKSDKKYAPLAKIGQRITDGVAKLDSDEVSDALRDMRAECSRVT
jgi:hypothetical protein